MQTRQLIEVLQYRQIQKVWEPNWELEQVEVVFAVGVAVAMEDRSTFGLDGTDLEAWEDNHILEGDTILGELHRAYLEIRVRVGILVGRIVEGKDTDMGDAAGNGEGEVVAVVAVAVVVDVVAVFVLSASATAGSEVGLEVAWAAFSVQHLAKALQQ